MRIIICLDDRKGLLFNHRRQSKDRKVIEDIQRDLTGTLYIAPYSERLFIETGIPYICTDHMFDEAGERDVCFVENIDFVSYLSSVNEITVYWWNRHYPSDVSLPIDFGDRGFFSVCRTDFAGFSHEKITKEIFRK